MPMFTTHKNGVSYPRVGRIIVAALLAVVVLSGGWYAVTYFTAEGRGRIALHNKQRSAEEIQASYEFFHDTCRAIIAQSQNINHVQAELDDLTAHPPTNDPFGQYQSQVGQVRTNLTGLQNIRSDTAQQYNAVSHEWTHNFMRSHDLPDEIGPPDGVPYDALRCENQGG